jgi:hypothetical protein
MIQGIVNKNSWKDCKNLDTFTANEAFSQFLRWTSETKNLEYFLILEILPFYHPWVQFSLNEPKI